jgi:two-component system, OmpR family, sensor histidine kinase KdpD
LVGAPYSFDAIECRPAVVCAASLASATAAAWAIDGAFSLASQALIYLLPVVFTAVYLRGTDAVITAVLGVSLLNFLFIPPRYTFLVEGPEYLISLGALLGVSPVVSGLVAGLKRETAAARLGEVRMAVLHELGQPLADADKPADIVARGATAVASDFGCAAEIRVTAPDGRQIITASAPQGGSVRIDEDALRWVVEHRSPPARFARFQSAWRRFASGRSPSIWGRSDACGSRTTCASLSRLGD